MKIGSQLGILTIVFHPACTSNRCQHLPDVTLAPSTAPLSENEECWVAFLRHTDLWKCILNGSAPCWSQSPPVSPYTPPNFFGLMTGDTHTCTHTERRTNQVLYKYCNPRCACTQRVNHAIASAPCLST